MSMSRIRKRSSTSTCGGWRISSTRLVRPGKPLRVLHLGAGALTLARYIEAVRPGSTQVAVDLERELLDFVLEALPLNNPANLTTLIGDAREVLTHELADRKFDVIVLDIFSGSGAPGHLTVPAFYAEMNDLLDCRAWSW